MVNLWDKGLRVSTSISDREVGSLHQVVDWIEQVGSSGSALPW